MTARLLEGKPIAAKIAEELTKEIADLKASSGKTPKLASIIVGDNAGAAIYAKSQAKKAEALGVDYELHKLPDTTKAEELQSFIEKLNNDQGVNGIIVQMPLPKGIDPKQVSRWISPLKDAEGMHPANIGECFFGKPKIGPCTAMSAIRLIEESGVDLYGKEVVCVGHSEIVGKPVAMMLLSQFGTVSVTHIATSEKGQLPEYVKRAEVLVVAVGVPGLVKGEWIREGAIVIDVGINRVDGKVVGDVEFEEAVKRAGQITPVPGGVGPLTVMMLMRNLVEAFKCQN